MPRQERGRSSPSRGALTFCLGSAKVWDLELSLHKAAVSETQPQTHYKGLIRLSKGQESSVGRPQPWAVGPPCCLAGRPQPHLLPPPVLAWQPDTLLQCRWASRTPFLPYLLDSVPMSPQLAPWSSLGSPLCAITWLCGTSANGSPSHPRAPPAWGEYFFSSICVDTLSFSSLFPEQDHACLHCIMQKGS